MGPIREAARRCCFEDHGVAVAPPRVLDFAAELRAWLARRKLDHGTILLTNWEYQRIEPGVHASDALVLLIEGSDLYYVINGLGDPRYDVKIYDAFSRFCEDRWWYWEQHHAYSVGLGPRKEM